MSRISAKHVSQVLFLTGYEKRLAKVTDWLFCLFVLRLPLKSNSPGHRLFAPMVGDTIPLFFDFLKKGQNSGENAFNLWETDKKAAVSICFAQKIRGITLAWPVRRDAA